MSLPDKIVAYEKNGVLSAVDQSRWEPEMARKYPENRVYRTLSEKELAQRRAASKKAQEKAVRGKNGRFVKGGVEPGGVIYYDKIDDFENWDEMVRQWEAELAPVIKGRDCRRYIPSRPWHWHLWMWLKVEVWEKFVLGRQS